MKSSIHRLRERDEQCTLTLNPKRPCSSGLMRIVMVGGCEWVGESSVKKEIRRSRYEVMDRDSTSPGEQVTLLLMPLLLLLFIGEQADAV